MRKAATLFGIVLGGAITMPALASDALDACAMDVTRTRNAAEMTCYTTLGPKQASYDPGPAATRDPLDACLADAWRSYLAGRDACEKSYGTWPPQPRPGVWEWISRHSTR